MSISSRSRALLIVPPFLYYEKQSDPAVSLPALPQIHVARVRERRRYLEVVERASGVGDAAGSDLKPVQRFLRSTPLIVPALRLA